VTTRKINLPQNFHALLLVGGTLKFLEGFSSDFNFSITQVSDPVVSGLIVIFLGHLVGYRVKLTPYLAGVHILD